MTKEQAKEFFPIMQAFAEGRVIECRTKPSTVEGTDVPNDWTEMKEIEYWNNTEYRIKPEVKFRPFANAEECWTEMKKHQPFGWIKEKVSKAFYCIGSFDVANIYVGTTSIIHSYADSLKNFTFADGSSFGVKVEE